MRVKVSHSLSFSPFLAGLVCMSRISGIADGRADMLTACALQDYKSPLVNQHVNISINESAPLQAVWSYYKSDAGSSLGHVGSGIDQL